MRCGGVTKTAAGTAEYDDLIGEHNIVVFYMEEHGTSVFLPG
jgi:hypothetical protein